MKYIYVLTARNKNEGRGKYLGYFKFLTEFSCPPPIGTNVFIPFKIKAHSTRFLVREYYHHVGGRGLFQADEFYIFLNHYADEDYGNFVPDDFPAFSKYLRSIGWVHYHQPFPA